LGGNFGRPGFWRIFGIKYDKIKGFTRDLAEAAEILALTADVSGSVTGSSARLFVGSTVTTGKGRRHLNMRHSSVTREE